MTEQLQDFATRLGLPATFCDRTASRTDAVDALLARHVEQVTEHGRRFHVGLLLAFVSFVEELLGQVGAESLSNALGIHPPMTQSGTRILNTLTVESPLGQGVIGLRPHYNRVEETIRATLERPSYPSMAPHATQAWSQHRRDIEDLFVMTPEERRAVVDSIWKEVLNLPRTSYRTTEDLSPRPFSMLIRDFRNQTGDPAGAVLQGLAYAYFACSATNLTRLEIRKVGAGSRRTASVGDVDGWYGGELVLTVEVKDLPLVIANAPGELASFLGGIATWQDATAIVVARAFDDETRTLLGNQGVVALSRAEIVADVERWDLRKQRNAVRAFEYFLARIQQHAGLHARFNQWLLDNEVVLP